MLPSEWEGWQAGQHCQSCKELCRCLCCVQSNWKGEKMALWQQTAVNETARSHSLGQWAAMEVTSAWLISLPIKSQPFPGPLTHAHGVTACTVFSYPVLSLVYVCVCLSLTHPGVISTVTKALVNTGCRKKNETKRSRNKNEERNPCSKMTQKETRGQANLFRASWYWDWILSIPLYIKRITYQRPNDPPFPQPPSCLSFLWPPGGNLGIAPHKGSWNSEFQQILKYFREGRGGGGMRLEWIWK